jgi:hypothetical protein
MKNVLMITDTNDLEYGGFNEFDTVAEAQTYATSMEGKVFDIFTLYTHGEIGAIAWDLQTDTATNMRENKKSKKSTEGMRRGAWTDTEEQTLRTNFEAGMSISELAASLKRAYNSIYTKLVALKLK